MKIKKENLDKIPLNELGDETRVWEVMLPEIKKHLDGESSIFDNTEAGNALLESAVIEPCLDEYWELHEKGAYTSKWTENDVREFKESMKARWSHLMWMVNEAMNGTLSENLEKNLDEAWERDFKIMHLLCGEIAAQDVVAPGVDDNSDLPF